MVGAFVAAVLIAGSAGAGDDGSGARAGRGGDRATARAEAIKERREAAREKAQDVKEKAQDARERGAEAASARVDKRQDNQVKRIQHGISKGYLTADEIAKLNTQQKSIAKLEDTLKSDGKLTVNEFRQLRSELNEASLCICAEKHDTDGKQMPTYRMDKNVFAKAELTSKLGDASLSKAEARALLKDFRRTVELKRLLATGDMSGAEREKLQDEYDTLLNRYFDAR
jgi:hypothetical protein